MQQSVWHKVPVVRLLLAFASGIGTSMFYPPSQWFIAAAVAGSLLAFLLLPKLFGTYQHKWLSGAAAGILFFFFGWGVHHVQNLKPRTHFMHARQPVWFLARITEEPVEKARSWKMRASVLQYTDSAGIAHTASGNLLLYLGKGQGLRLPAYGDVVWVGSHQVREIPGPRNPGEFDYKRYLAFHYIYHQAYVHELAYTTINTGHPLMMRIYRIQHFFTGALRKYVTGANEVGVAQALLYGYDDAIDQETASAYANTGTLHVLAVSGMHVGLILWIMSQLLFFMKKNRHSRLVRDAILLVSIWAYSALCGLSPSILRATVMFTFIIIAQVTGRRSNIYNTLAASCLVLLCADANMLANVGFQLSYMAVLGIVFLQPLIGSWYTATTWIGRQVWSITSVSIAAQMGTSPISILYFHQFPNCFLFSNLLIIPLTTLIIYAAILLLLFSWWEPAATVLGTMVKHIISFTNQLVALVEKIPYSYVNGLQITIAQCIVLYLLLISAVFYFISRKQWLFKLSLASLLYFLVLSASTGITQQRQHQLVVYAIPGSNAIHVITGRSSVLLLDSVLRTDKQRFRFHLQQHLWQCGLEQIDTQTLSSAFTEIRAGGRRVLITGLQPAVATKKTDVLVIRHPTDTNLIGELDPAAVVITGTVKQRQSTLIGAYCRRKNIPVYNVLDSGAYQLIL